MTIDAITKKRILLEIKSGWIHFLLDSIGQTKYIDYDTIATKQTPFKSLYFIVQSALLFVVVNFLFNELGQLTTILAASIYLVFAFIKELNMMKTQFNIINSNIITQLNEFDGLNKKMKLLEITSFTVIRLVSLLFSIILVLIAISLFLELLVYQMFVVGLIYYGYYIFKDKKAKNKNKSELLYALFNLFKPKSLKSRSLYFKDTKRIRNENKKIQLIVLPVFGLFAYTVTFKILLTQNILVYSSNQVVFLNFVLTMLFSLLVHYYFIDKYGSLSSDRDYLPFYNTIGNIYLDLFKEKLHLSLVYVFIIEIMCLLTFIPFITQDLVLMLVIMITHMVAVGFFVVNHIKYNFEDTSLNNPKYLTSDTKHAYIILMNRNFFVLLMSLSFIEAELMMDNLMYLFILFGLYSFSKIPLAIRRSMKALKNLYYIGYGGIRYYDKNK